MKISIFLLLFLSSSLGTLAQLQSRQRCAQGVEAFIKNTMVKEGTYRGYSFGNLTTHKPKAYQELDELQQLKEVLPDMKHHYKKRKLDSLLAATDSAIQNKKREIMDKGLHVSYEIPHTFMIKEGKNENRAYRYDFFLNHAYKVKDVRITFSILLTDGEAKGFHYFQKGSPIFDLEDHYENEEASRELYEFFEDGLDKSDNDPEIVKAASRTVRIIKQVGYLDMDRLGRVTIDDWIAKNKDQVGASRIDNSYMFEINKEVDGSKTLIGYKMFYKYSYKDKEDKKVEDVVYFEFDKYFVIRGVMRVNPPHDQYFEKN